MYFEQSGVDGTRILNRIEDYCRRHAGLGGLISHPGSKLVRMIQELHAGEEMVLFKDKINFKLPGGDGFKAHQDQQAGWGKYIKWFVTVGVCVDDATPENGCLEIAPGLHKQGP